MPRGELFDPAREVDTVLQRLEGFDTAAMERTLRTDIETEAVTTRARIDDLLRSDPRVEKQLQTLYRSYLIACEERRYRDAILFLEKRLELNEEPGLRIELGKLYLVVGEFDRAYALFRSICRHHQVLNAEQAHEALWFLFKSWHLQQISEVTEHLFRRKHAPLLREIQQRFGQIFLDIFQTLGMVAAFRRGAIMQETPGVGRETGYDETIRLGEHYGILTHERPEVERRRLVGAAYFKKAEEGQSTLPLLRGLARQQTKQHLLAWVTTSKDHTRAGIQVAMRLPKLEREGEIGRIKYNHAKTLMLRAQIDPGNSEWITPAIAAIRLLKEFGESTGNPILVSRAHLLQSELLLSGTSAKPSLAELQAALRANHRALEMPNLKEDIILSALINSAEILLQLEEKLAAERCVRKAMTIYRCSTDKRIVDPLAIPLRRLCARVEIEFVKPRLPV